MTSFHNYLRIKQYPLLREHILAIRKILDTYSKPQTLPGGKRAMKPVLLTGTVSRPKRTLRPVYYASGLFTRFARRGMTPIALKLSAESCEFNAAAIRDGRGGVTLYLVNLSDKPAKATLSGLPKGRYRRYEYTRARAQKLAAAGDNRIASLNAGEVQVEENQRPLIKPEALVVLSAPH
jgi:hypothetical protein